MGLLVSSFPAIISTCENQNDYEKMDQDWYIKRKIKCKEKERFLLVDGITTEAREYQPETKYCERHSKVKSKINKHIMTPVYPVGRIFIDGEKWVTEML